MRLQATIDGPALVGLIALITEFMVSYSSLNTSRWLLSCRFSSSLSGPTAPSRVYDTGSFQMQNL